MPVRYLLVCAFLVFVLACTGLLATDVKTWWLAPVHWLGRYPLFHVIAHSGIFAGVVFLYRPQDHNSGLWLWVIVFSGSLLLELIQIAVGGFSLTKPLLLDSVLDIVVDVAGALVCWILLTRQRRTRSAQKPI